MTTQEMYDQLRALPVANWITFALIEGDGGAKKLQFFDAADGILLEMDDELPPEYGLHELLAELHQKFGDAVARWRYSQALARANEKNAARGMSLVREQLALMFLTGLFPEAVGATPIGGSTKHFNSFAKTVEGGKDTVYAVQWKDNKPFAAARINATYVDWVSAVDGIAPNQRHGMFWIGLAREFLARTLFDGNLPSDLNVQLVPAVQNFAERRGDHELYSVAGAVFSRHSGGVQYHVVFENGLPVRVAEVQP